MELRRNEKITFRCTELEKDALAEQAARCSLSVSEYCRSLSLGGRPRERYTEEERQLLRDIAQLKGTLQRLNNYFGGRQYREVFEDYIWHWFMVIGYEESKEDLLVQTATYGEKKTFSFAELWNTGFEERGGMVLYDLDFENPDF